MICLSHVFTIAIIQIYDEFELKGHGIEIALQLT